MTRFVIQQYQIDEFNDTQSLSLGLGLRYDNYD